MITEAFNFKSLKKSLPVPKHRGDKKNSVSFTANRIFLVIVIFREYKCK